jgi:hypothetical protein
MFQPEQQRTTSRTRAFGVALAFGIALIAGGLMFFGRVPAPGDFRAQPVTLAKFTALRTGMTYAEATSVMGISGTEVIRTEHDISYLWRNPDGTNVNATFQDGKLTRKAQFGLK